MWARPGSRWSGGVHLRTLVHQLHRIPHRVPQVLVFSPGIRMGVRIPPRPVGRFPWGRMKSHYLAKSCKRRVSRSRRSRLATACETLRRIAAPDYAPVVPENAILAERDTLSRGLANTFVANSGEYSRNARRLGANFAQFERVARISISDGWHESTASRTQAARR